MGDVLIIGDTFRSPELRHEVPLGVPDPFVYLERDGARHVYVGSMEVERIRGARRDLTVHPLEEIGIDELYAQELGRQRDPARMGGPGVRPRRARARRRAAHVPCRSPRPAEARGDRADRRPGRCSTSAAGSRPAPSSRASAAPSARPRRVSPPASRCCARAENGDGVLWLDGEPLTVERVKAAMRRVFAEHGCSAEEFIVAPGPQGAVGHEMGHGPIRLRRAGRVRPLAARRRVVLLRRHDPHGRRRPRRRRGTRVAPADEGGARGGDRPDPAPASSAARSSTPPATSSRPPGYPTQRTKAAGEVLRHGFFHGLGHGVGLEVHEGPYMGLLPGGTLLAGDVVTLEPGLYDPPSAACGSRTSCSSPTTAARC